MLHQNHPIPDAGTGTRETLTALSYLLADALRLAASLPAPHVQWLLTIALARLAELEKSGNRFNLEAVPATEP
jgi:hypothetical protein